MDGAALPYLNTKVEDVRHIQTDTNLQTLVAKVDALGAEGIRSGVTGLRNLEAFQALIEAGSIGVSGALRPTNKLGAAGVALSALFAASAEGASSPEEARAIMEKWALDAVGSEVDRSRQSVWREPSLPPSGQRPPCQFR